MKYEIKITTYEQNKTGEAVISKALGFKKELSNGTIVDIFAKDLKHKNGVLTSKKRAQIIAGRINERGAFGGYDVKTIAEVVAA